MVLDGCFQEIRHVSIVKMDGVVYAWVHHNPKALEKQEEAPLEKEHTVN